MLTKGWKESLVKGPRRKKAKVSEWKNIFRYVEIVAEQLQLITKLFQHIT
jgi:hypothetical protein